MISSPGPRSGTRTSPPRAQGGVRLLRVPDAEGRRAIDVAESFRDLPGLALLESGRPGRNARWSYLVADPRAVLETPAPSGDPFGPARSLLARLDRSPVAGAPPFSGGLAGYLGYDLGRRLERLPSVARDDQPLPLLRLALHDWVIAWDHRAETAWLVGRALDGDLVGLDRRLAEVVDRLGVASRAGSAPGGSAGGTTTPSPGRFAPSPAADERREGAAGDDALRFVSGLPRPAWEARVELIRAAIGRGELYQANLTRRLETPFGGDPWPLYRRLRTGDPARFAAFLDLGGGRALLSASPEPFLALTPDGAVSTDPIKGTRPRGGTPAEDRSLARELLESGKDRAENVMIVDVLRNDLGRVCRPGSVRVPRLCRLERTATVQHLVSTVTGRLAAGRDAFHLLAATLPGGSITGAPKIRAMTLLESLEPVRRGPYTGAIGWIGADGAMSTSIAIRTFVADGDRLTLHVGGGITWRSDPAEEWEETVAKARGPLGAIGAREVPA